ncbi:MAG: tRNA pseudouridine(38-40) synthase TruA [Desulfobulbus sp.]|jgi:tRNA pseudouridine38-40 synthase|uniref:tRNA pseudouridine(38-40) synthase TruA n=1 Tax=Desulfobulbus sp. TaxID=895 RepID=UPI002843E2F8|nr:tRNA pseudouridine(38-40) synthase TruA [Desulfobulbus sp.]MDR2550208.1 tRNA pseudouridine(38-40) synthase TruA [Desulfobulbus sp.]
MPRTIRLLIAYDGSGYHGWQRQRQGEPTIQQELETRLSALSQQPVTLHGAGRTDAGVHALGMVAHFHTSATMPLVAFSKGLNALLPPDIRILGAEEAPSHFHSRFSALGKTYRYDFFTGPVQLPGSRFYQAHCPGPFVPERLKPALAVLVGTHDFSSFERSGSRDKEATDGRGAVRSLNRISCVPVLARPGHWSIRFTGDGFLRQMVRILSGTLIEIGQGKRRAEEAAAILAARDRTAAGHTAPACGLFLENIHYSPQIFCPQAPCS